MNRTHKSMLRSVPILLAIAIALPALLGAPRQADAAAYGADNYYLLMKREMYGRAKLDLLRRRVLLRI